MSFIKRIGTEEVQFNIELHLQKLSLNINAPDCLVHILFQRGERKIQTTQPALLQNKIAIFNEVLELPITLYHDRKKKTYQEKKGDLFILLQGARGIKKAGEIHLEISQYLNQNEFFKGEILHLQKCPDPNATLQLTIVLKSNNVSQEQVQKISFKQISKVEEEENQEEEFVRSPSSPTRDRKQTGYPLKKKQLNVIDSTESKNQVSINLIGSSIDISPILTGQKFDEKMHTEQEISSLTDLLETKEELKYLLIELGQYKNTSAKLRAENCELLEKINQLQNLVDLTQIENKQMQSKLKKTKINSEPEEVEKPQNYGSNIELQQLLLENQKLKDNVIRVKREKDVLQLQIGASQELGSSGRSSEITDDERNKLNTKIIELESRLQNDPNIQENKLSKLALENEQLKRKMQDLINRHTLETSKLRDENEDAMQDAIRHYVEQVENLTPYKEKYDNMNSQYRKNQQDLENLRLNKFELEDKVQQKQLNLQQLEENELLKVKQNIAGAMTEFLTYGDPMVIEVMEYYMT